MRLDELQQALEKVNPAAVLVAPSVLDYLIQKVGKLPAWTWGTPHRHCFTVDRQMLFLYFNQEELGLEPGRLLPATLILLPRPSPDELKNRERGDLLLKYWRRLFHARIHLALTAEGQLAPEQVQQRIEHIGAREFDEIRQVLAQESFLLPGADERDIYVEFAAVYLELRQFAPPLLAGFFPGIRDHCRIDNLLSLDVNAQEIFEQTRPVGAAEPVAQPEDLVDEAHQYFRKLMARAALAARSGNTVRAAILERQAARVAPDPPAMEAKAKNTLQNLTTRLQSALPLSDDEAGQWHENLSILLDKADQGARPVEAALLYDLQKLCLEHERDIFVLDMVGWLLNVGKQPIKRSLPRQKPVLIIRHLRHALGRLTKARLSDTDRQRIGQLLEKALHQREDRLRSEFRGIITSAFQDAGLEPTNVPERAAYHKIVEEVLDRITAEGFLTFADLRDTVSRNQLKLADLADPQAFLLGDNLLRLDKRLAALLDGVYRPSEIYIRWLERISALSFGTAAGRLVTSNVTLPVGGSFLLLEGINLIFGRMPLVAFVPLFLLLTGLFWALLHRPRFRRACGRAGWQFLRGARVVLVDFPIWLIRASPLERAVKTWSFQLFYSYLFKPLLVCALVWYFRPELVETVLLMVIVFMAANFLVNSRPGRAAGEAVKQLLLTFFELVRAGLIPGLIRLTLAAFQEIIHLMEYLLAIVDEWLLFRTGQGRFLMVARAILFVLWFPVAYVGRFYMVVLIEPGLNPVKLPISSFAAKFIYPLFAPLFFSQEETVWSTSFVGWLLVGTLWLLPDAVGFLVWEFKENWSLFAANRSRFVRPVAIGSHGETVARLLRPGFHSGTVPKLFSRLRQAERKAHRSGDWTAVRECRHRLDDVAQAVKRFVERDLVFFLLKVNDWPAHTLTVEQVALATNQINIQLRLKDYPEALRLSLEERCGWLLAGIDEPGWLAQLPEEQVRTFNVALAGFYRFAGVDLVHEQLRASLPPRAAGYDVKHDDLVVWMDHQHGQAVHFALRPGEDSLPRLSEDVPDQVWPRRLIFAQAPLTWHDLVQSWQPASPDGQATPFRPANGPAAETYPDSVRDE